MHLETIFEKLGIPTNETWPGIEDQPLYQQVLKKQEDNKKSGHPVKVFDAGGFDKYLDQHKVVDT